MEALQDNNTIMFIIDEVGFNKPLKRYGYEIKGKPLVLKGYRRIKNLTCTACLSTKGVEAIRFFDSGGTKNEYYYDYFNELLENLKLKYP